MIAYGDNIKIFCGNSNPQFAETICRSLGVPLGRAEVKTFADGEVSVSLEETGSQIPAREDPAPTLLSAVQALPEAYSAVIHLYYYEGYSIKEIAKLLRLPASTVGTRLARGRERLRRILKEEMS